MATLNFQQPLLQSSLSRDRSEIRDRSDGWKIQISSAIYCILAE